MVLVFVGDLVHVLKAINIGIVMIVGSIHRQRAINHQFVFQKMAFQLSGTAQCHIIVNLAILQQPFMVGGHAITLAPVMVLSGLALEKGISKHLNAIIQSIK